MDVGCGARRLGTALALVGAACQPDERVRAEPVQMDLSPEVTRLSDMPVRGRIARVDVARAGADTPAASGNNAARPDPRAPQMRVPVTTTLVISDLTPAGSPEPGPPQVVSFATGALLSPSPSPMTTAGIQGLPASPQSYSSVRTNFGPTGAILGGSFAAPSYGSAIR